MPVISRRPCLWLRPMNDVAPRQACPDECGERWADDSPDSWASAFGRQKSPRRRACAGKNALGGLGGRIKRAERSNTPSGFLFDRSTRKKMHGRKATSWKRVQIVLFNLERRDSGDRTPKEAITPRLVRKRFALGPFAPTLRRLTRAPSMRRKSVSARRSG
jgi:hypothetical protein